MAFPTFVSAGAQAGQASGTSITPALPASLANGNILIAIVSSTASATAKTFAFPAGWTVVGAVSQATASSAIAYRIVDGSEVAPAITWTGNTSARARIVQYSGVNTADPIGHVRSAWNIGTTPSQGGVTTQASDSRALVAICGGATGTETMPTPPASYAADSAFQAGTGGFTSLFGLDVATVGTIAPTCSATISPSSRWSTITFELQSGAPAPPPLNLAASFVDLSTFDAKYELNVSASFVDASVFTAVLLPDGYSGNFADDDGLSVSPPAPPEPPVRPSQVVVTIISV